MENTTATPNVTLGQYKGLPVTRHVRPVSEKAVEHNRTHSEWTVWFILWTMVGAK